MDELATVIDIVQTFHSDFRVPYAPDGLVHDFHGEDAEELIFRSADSIGLSQALVAKHFPFPNYFEPEVNPTFWPFTVLKDLCLWCLGRSTKTVERRPITVQAFAELIVSIKRTYA